MSGSAKGPFGADWEERVDLARLILATEVEPRVLTRVKYEERSLG